MNKRVTLNDIAKELQMAPATVSRALSDHPEISAATKKRVKEVADRLDYNPNRIASSLRSGTTKVIGVIIPTAEHVFFGSVVHGISNVASLNGYDILIYQSNEDQNFERKGIDTFMSARVDGILISVAKGTKDYSHLIKARDKGIPIAFFDRINDGLGIPSVTIDDHKGAYLATEAMIRKGYTKIAHISGLPHIKAFAERLRGYQDALQAYELPLKTKWIYPGDSSIEAGRAGVRELFKAKDRPDAILAAEDFTALGALKELKAMKIVVPDEVGIFGFSNDLFGEHTTPSLSTVDQQTIKMGEESFLLIKALIDRKNDKDNIKDIVLEPILIERESTDR
jgi:LacI family transcriptional regulator